MGQKETTMNGKNRIMIFGPKNDGTYIIEFRTAAGEALAISARQIASRCHVASGRGERT
jgi:hypothetical protein